MSQRVLCVLCLALGLTGFSGPTSAMTGNELLEYCERERNADFAKGICIGYITGAISTLQLSTALFLSEANQKKVGVCIPQKVTNGQKRELIVRELQKNPDYRHRQAVLLIAIYTKRAFH